MFGITRNARQNEQTIEEKKLEMRGMRNIMNRKRERGSMSVREGVLFIINQMKNKNSSKVVAKESKFRSIILRAKEKLLVAAIVVKSCQCCYCLTSLAITRVIIMLMGCCWLLPAMITVVDTVMLTVTKELLLMKRAQHFEVK